MKHGKDVALFEFHVFTVVVKIVFPFSAQFVAVVLSIDNSDFAVLVNLITNFSGYLPRYH